MAISQSDYLLQEMLNKSSSANDNLSAMRDLLIELNKNVKKGSSNSPGGGGGSGGGGSGSSDSNAPDPKKYSNMFKQMFGNMRGAGNTILGNNSSAANVMGSLGTSATGLATSLGRAIPVVGGVTQAFTMLVDAGMAVYNYMNAQLEMYNELNSSGLTLATGMSTLERASAKSLMSNVEFGEALKRNSDVLAAMEGQYGHGVEGFGNLLNTVQKLQTVNGLYGVSQQQLADMAARNFKYQKLYGTQESLRSSAQAQSTDLFVRQMTSLSKSVGKSVDQLLGNFENLTDSFDSQTNARSLERFWGLSMDQAADVNKAMNTVYASLGDVGVKLQAANTMKMSQQPLTEEFNNFFTQMLTDRMREIQRAGVKDPKQIQKHLSDYIKSHEKQLQLEIDAQYDAKNIPAAKFLEDLRNSMQMMNEQTSDVSPVMEEFTNRFNTWLQDSVTGPFKTMWADTRDSALRYLMDTYDSVDSIFMMPAQMMKDLLSYITEGMGGMGTLFLGLPGQLMDIITTNFGPVKEAFGKFMGDLMDIPGRLGEFLWGMLTGDGLSKSAEGLQKTINSLFGHITEMFDGIMDLEFDYDDMKAKVLGVFQSMKDKLSGIWDSAKSWIMGDDKKTPEPSKKSKTEKLSEQNKTETKAPTPPPTSVEKKHQTAQVTEPPQYTKPEKIEKVEKEVAPVMDVANNQATLEESILKTLNNLMSVAEQTNQINNNAGMYLRQIAENTAGAQNV